MSYLVTDHALINNARIAHGTFGSGDAVVLIHGTPSSSYIWRDVVPGLIGAGYKVHVYDLLGFGLSERPWAPSVDTSVTGQVPILEGLLDMWGLDDLHVIAHDIGGAVASRFAVQSPERVRSLTLIDIVSFDSWPSKRTKEQMQAGLQQLVDASDADHRAHFHEWLLSAVHNKDRLVQASMDTYLDLISGPIGQGSLFQHQVRHYGAKHTNNINYEKLGALPVQLIWGADDAWQVVDWAHKLHNTIPGSELHVLENCGHFAMEDQPDRIASLLVDFLKRKG